MKNKIQLITYANSLGGDLKALDEALAQHFSGVFGGIHILPPFPSTGDRGFAPTTYFEIDPQFGSWADIQHLGEQYDILLDVMVNHISRHSTYFQDFQMKGRKSEYADAFITLEKVWPDGKPLEEDVKKIFLRRPKTPFLEVKIEESGETETIWATFGAADWSEQIDLDIHSPITQELFRKILSHFAAQGVGIIRLDAVAYVNKKAGTSCFFVKPDLFEFLEWMAQEAGKVGIQLLLEVHSPEPDQDELAQRGYWIYNFVLPFLILHSLVNHTTSVLQAHLKRCPRRQITMLDCHDGIPVLPDLEGVVPEEAMRSVVAHCEKNGANISRIYSPGESGFDAHQINCTYYSALDENDDAYICARAMQFFAPGIPQVYYVGALAGKNTPEEVQQFGDRRAINRHDFSPDEIAQACEQSVVQRLVKLMQFRNTFPAFDGTFAVVDSADGALCLAWTKDGYECRLTVNTAERSCDIAARYPDGKVEMWKP